jgi:hypothetical protein
MHDISPWEDASWGRQLSRKYNVPDQQSVLPDWYNSNSQNGVRSLKIIYIFTYGHFTKQTQF